MSLQQIPDLADGAINADVPATEPPPGPEMPPEPEPVVVRRAGRPLHGGLGRCYRRFITRIHFDNARRGIIGTEGLGIGGRYWRVLSEQSLRVT